MEAVLLVRPSDDLALKDLKAQASKVLADAKGIEVHDRDSSEWCTAYLGEIAAIKKKAEGRRTELKGPLLEAGRALDGFVAELLKPILEADTLLRGRLLAYQQEQIRKAHAAAERIRREAEAAEQAAAQAAAQGDGHGMDHALLQAADKKQEAQALEKAPTAIQAAGMGSATIRKVWAFEVVNVAQVPREFLAVDEQAIRKAVAAGIREIAGVRIFEQESLSIGASKF